MFKVRLSAKVDGRWEPQGAPIYDFEFTALNEDLEPAVKLSILALEPGKHVVLNEGCHGIFKVERV